MACVYKSDHVCIMAPQSTLQWNQMKQTNPLQSYTAEKVQFYIQLTVRNGSKQMSMEEFHVAREGHLTFTVEENERNTAESPHPLIQPCCFSGQKRVKLKAYEPEILSCGSRVSPAHIRSLTKWNETVSRDTSTIDALALRNVPIANTWAWNTAELHPTVAYHL